MCTSSRPLFHVVVVAFVCSFGVAKSVSGAVTVTMMQDQQAPKGHDEQVLKIANQHDDEVWKKFKTPTAWILLGLQRDGEWASVESYKTARKSTIDRITPTEGDLIVLTRAAELVILDFKPNRSEKYQLESPATRGKCTDNDYTGVFLQPGAHVIVNDVKSGLFGPATAVWARVSPVPPKPPIPKK
jgi:hypothetical protein